MTGGLVTAAVQRRTLRLLVFSQVVGGVGVGIGVAFAALLAAELAGVRASGLAVSVAVVGAGLLAALVSRIMRQYGRGPGLTAAYLLAATGGAGVVTAGVVGSAPLLFAGLFLFGGGTTAGLQARFAATDLAPASRRARHLSLVIWATTVGAVAGPNLAPLAGRTLAGSSVPTLASPFVFSGALFAVAAVALLWLRPDPLLLARELTGDPSGGAGSRAGLRVALAQVRAQPQARLAVAAMAVGYVVMVAVMAMTPVHLQGAGYDPAHTLRVVGVVISIHVAGMYAFSPVLGWLADRYGRRPVILGGAGLLLAACLIAGTAGHHSVQLSVGLLLLGQGWSALMVAGSALLTESVPESLRPATQGLADLVSLLAGAVAGAVAGVVVAWAGYPTLTLLAAVATVPLVALALRPGRPPAVRAAA